MHTRQYVQNSSLKTVKFAASRLQTVYVCFHQYRMNMIDLHQRRHNQNNYNCINRNDEHISQASVDGTMRGIVMKHYLLYLIIVIFSVSTGVRANTLPETDAKPAAGDKLKPVTLQIPFVKNVGQANADVVFYADTFGGALLVKKQGVLELIVPQTSGNKTPPPVISESFTGASIDTIEGASLSPARVSYFLGSKPEYWRSNIPTYEVISMGDIYEGIELRLKSYGNTVEKLFHLGPGADPKLIRVNITGAESIKITEQGQLALNTKHGSIKYSRPRAYQIIDNETRQVDVAYSVAGDTYSFELGNYDTGRELIIDPLLQSTYFGGSGNDVVRELGIAPNGNVYAVGYTDSAISRFLLTPDGTDAFVARFSSSLGILHNVSFIGGMDDGADYAAAIAFHSLTPDEFEIYVAGNTASADLAGLAQGGADANFGTASTGETEGFVARFTSDLTALLGTTYYGGGTPVNVGISPDDSINAIAINSNGVFITGTTSASDIPLVSPIPVPPPTQGAFGGGNSDAFVAQLNFNLDDILAASYLGGTGDDDARDIVLDSTTAFIAGRTSSVPFPGVTNTLGGGYDAFVTEINQSLDGTVSSTYIGGDGDEQVQALVNTGTGISDTLVYLAGTTASTDFPLGASPAVFADQDDNFIARINKDLATDYQATYLGGGDVDQLWDMALYKEAGTFDINTDSVYVTGSKNSHLSFISKFSIGFGY